MILCYYRYLFYSDWQTPAKIGRCDMDGTDLRILVDGSDLRWPNGLAIDYSADRIYWADANIDIIESIYLNGTGRQKTEPVSKHIFGLDVTDEFIYWTDWLSKSITRAKKSNVSEQTIFRGNYGALMEIRVYDKSRQNGKQK